MTYHLGFPGRIVGKPALRSHDARRTPVSHLSISLIALRDILLYLQHINVSFYRLATSFLPGLHDADDCTPALRQVDACARELDMVATQIASQQVRLTLHLDYTIALGSSDEHVARHSLAVIETYTTLFHTLRLPPESVLVVHAGGHDRAALERFAARYAMLSDAARQRLVIEHDSDGVGLGMFYWLHQQCGVPIVFDYLHYVLNNPQQLPPDIALGMALATWPPGVRPKVHLSTARSEAHLLAAGNGHTARIAPPRRGQHADFIAVTDLLALLQAARGLPPFDIMLEAKAGDVALLRVRAEIARYTHPQTGS